MNLQIVFVCLFVSEKRPLQWRKLSNKDILYQVAKISDTVKLLQTLCVVPGP